MTSGVACILRTFSRGTSYKDKRILPQLLADKAHICSSRLISSASSHMSSDQTTSHGSDHLERTAENTRENVLSAATVRSIKDISPTVKLLTLDVQDRRLTFKAGQWVDFYIPAMEKVGGYSMCSWPQMLEADHTLQLAVKYSEHPPAYWVHKQCKENSKVELRVGGDFYYDAITQPNVNLLLIAGGVGINPLYSIMKHCSEAHNENNTSKVHLMYSAATHEELVFKNDIDNICRGSSSFTGRYFITKQDSVGSSSEDVAYGRIDDSAIQEAVKILGKEKLLCYLCGPSPMIKDIEQCLQKQGIDKNQIKYEQWW